MLTLKNVVIILLLGTILFIKATQQQYTPPHSKCMHTEANKEIAKSKNNNQSCVVCLGLLFYSRVYT